MNNKKIEQLSLNAMYVKNPHMFWSIFIREALDPKVVKPQHIHYVYFKIKVYFDFKVLGETYHKKCFLKMFEVLEEEINSQEFLDEVNNKYTRKA